MESVEVMLWGQVQVTGQSMTENGIQIKKNINT